MTTVNWERLTGESVQELVAALIRMANPQGNPITPSRGDRGIDIRLRTPDGIAVYQVKRYARALTATQARDIEHSWETFCEQGIPALGDAVASWTLVLPWNPTNERVAWLNEMSGGCGFPTYWMGRVQLDVLAALHPSIVNYYLGNGAEQVTNLMAQALGAAREISDKTSGGALLEAARDRTLQLSASLDAVDPFYSYSFQVRDGAMPEMFGPEMEADISAAFVSYEQLGDGRHLAMVVNPRSPWSTWLRPIQRTIAFSVRSGTVEAEAMERFLHYGAPIDRMPFTTISAEGPPGTTDGDAGVASVIPIGRPGNDFELRIMNPGEDAVPVQLVGGVFTTGLSGDGYRFTATDSTGVVNLEVLGHGGAREIIVNLGTSGWEGKPVGRVLPLVRAMRKLRQGTRIEIAVAGAAAFAHGEWPHPTPALAPGVADWIEALGAIQHHVRRPILVPAEASEDEVQSVRRALALLVGKVLPMKDESVMVPADVDTITNQESAFLAHIPLAVELNGEPIELDLQEVIYSKHVRFEPTDQARVARVVAVLPMTARAVSSSWQPPGPGSEWARLPPPPE